MSECLIYYLKEGITKVGSGKNSSQDIQLCGSYILPEHCKFENIDDVITLIPHEKSLCYVNGQEIKSPFVLKTGSRVILGKNHVFRFTHPEQGILLFYLFIFFTGIILYFNFSRNQKKFPFQALSLCILINI